jgi:hypothetical protein
MAQRSLLYKAKAQEFMADLEAPFKPSVQAAFQAPIITHGVKKRILPGIEGHAAIHGLRCHLYMLKIESVIKSTSTSLDGEEDVPRHEKSTLRIQGSA